MKMRIYILALLAPSLMASIAFAQTVTVAVASNLKPAFEEIYQDFRQSNPQIQTMRIVYGSSGNLASQMKQGAPYDLFISADESFPLLLAQEGVTRDQGVVYASGHLALITNTAARLPLSSDLEGIKTLLRGAGRIAIANPELAPYGKASAQYLKAINLWGELQGKVVFAENISIAAVYVSTGAVKVGFTALSLAKSPDLSATIQYIALPDDLYAPIKQRMVLKRKAAPAAISLYDYLQGPAARQVLVKNGYSIPW
jgi:molybdate transport system substrate-binding protein